MKINQNTTIEAPQVNKTTINTPLVNPFTEGQFSNMFQGIFALGAQGEQEQLLGEPDPLNFYN